MNYIAIFFLLLIFVAAFFIFKRLHLQKQIQAIQSFIKENNIDDAQELLQKIHPSKDLNDNVVWLQAQINMKLGHYSLVLNALNNLLKDKDSKYMNIDQISMRKMLSKVYEKTMQMDAAEKEYKMILFLDKDDLETNFNLGKLYFDKGLYAKAKYYLLQSLSYDKESYITLYMISFLYEKENDLENAKKYISASLKINKDYKPAMFLAAKLLYFNRKFKEARDVFKIFDESSEYYIEAQTFIALSYFEDMKKSQFIEVAENIIDKITDYNIYNDLLAKLISTYIETKQLNEALNLMEHVAHNSMVKESIQRKIDSYRYVKKYAALKNIVLLDNDDFSNCIKDMLENNGYIIDKIEVNNDYFYFSVLKEQDKSLVVVNKIETVMTLSSIKTMADYARENNEYFLTVLTPFVFDDQLKNFTSDRLIFYFYNGDQMGKILNGELKI